jgi:hypothetical protein
MNYITIKDIQVIGEDKYMKYLGLTKEGYKIRSDLRGLLRNFSTSP